MHSTTGSTYASRMALFYGATPRDESRNAYRPAQASADEGSSEAQVERIIEALRHSAVAGEALVSGIAGTALGQERVNTCRERRWDAEQTLRYLEKWVNKPAADWSDEDLRKTQLQRVQANLEGLRKALSNLDAHERLAERAVRPNRTPTGLHPQDKSPRGKMHSPRGPDPSKRGRAGAGALDAGEPPTCSKMSAIATSLIQRAQAARGEEKNDNSSWFAIILCCTSRGDAWDHEQATENCIASLDRFVYNTKRGDILCCAPADMMVDAVRYAHSPGAPIPNNTIEDHQSVQVQRGDRILIQGRRNGWVFNKNGWLPLWHPQSCNPEDAQVLFAYDHRSTTFDEDSDDTDDSGGTDISDSSLLPATPAGRSDRCLVINTWSTV